MPMVPLEQMVQAAEEAVLEVAQVSLVLVVLEARVW